MDALQVVGTIANCAGAMATLVAAEIARRALKNYRHQIKFQNDQELGRRLLSVTFQLRDILKESRAPIVGPEEQAKARKRYLEEVGSLPLNVTMTDLAMHFRVRRVLQVCRKARTVANEAAAAWSVEWAKCYLEQLTAPAWRFRDAVSEYAFFKNDRGGGFRSPQELLKIIHPSGTKENPDEFDRDLDDVVDAIERMVRPKLEPPPDPLDE